LFYGGVMAHRERSGSLAESPQTGILRILLVDDHALFRESVSLALSKEPGFDVEHCGSIRDAMQHLAHHEFHLVLLDHDLGNERASQFIPAARQAGFEGRVLIVTAWVSDTEARRLMRQGVSGIFLKDAPLSRLVEGIHAVRSGGVWFDPSFSEVPPDSESAQNNAPVFNERQRKVLRFVLEGLSNKEIAWRLQISESYVKAILQGLFQKTGVRTRGQLVRVAFEQYEDQI
jgi:two-component system, NarL family, nitrate/nitrite response regulator NarL